MEGLASLLQRTFGVTLRLATSQPGEVCHPTVRRIEVLADSGELCGTVYIDLFAREGKSAHAAHHTVQCGCRRGDEAQLPIVVVVSNVGVGVGCCVVLSA